MGVNLNKKRFIFKSIFFPLLIFLSYILVGCSGIINRVILPSQPSTKQKSQILQETAKITQSSIWVEKEGQFALIPEKELHLIERDFEGWTDLDYFSRHFGRWAYQSEEEAGEEIEMVLNMEVDKFIQYFTSNGRDFFSGALRRSGRYLPIMQEIFRDNGLPEDLVYLALIESGFYLYATSPANAVGPWQFIKTTGQRYGLVINRWVDERRDPVKSTYAASQYLKDLYNLFGSWHLANAGYNAGEFRIIKAIEKANTNDFWELAKNGYLRRETRDFVPKFLAAAIIAKNPEKYGFRDINYERVLKYDEVKIKKPVDLLTVAEASQTSLKEIKLLNPELKKEITPPNHDDYKLKLPYGTKARFLSNMRVIEARKKGSPVEYMADIIGKGTIKYVVKQGDNLYKIAQSYGLPVKNIIITNELKNSDYILPGQILYITLKETGLSGNGDNSPKHVSKLSKKNEIQKPESLIYEVKKGDTLWNIAQVYDVDFDKIAEWNRLSSNNFIKPGDKLKIFILKD